MCGMALCLCVCVFWNRAGADKQGESRVRAGGQLSRGSPRVWERQLTWASPEGPRGDINSDWREVSRFSLLYDATSPKLEVQIVPYAWHFPPDPSSGTVGGPVSCDRARRRGSGARCWRKAPTIWLSGRSTRRSRKQP